MQEIIILNEVVPVIEINFEEVKRGLTETLQEYKGYVVTDENLSLCKATQKKLAGLRTDIDTYRKDKKKILSAPIVDFENQCKELISLVEQAEQPIKDGIKVFDDVKREEKRQTALKIIEEAIIKIGLNEKYASELYVEDKYCNLSAKKSDVKTDVEQRAFALKIDQDREQELLEIIQDTIDTENQRINKKLTLADFNRLIQMNVPTKDILQEIKQRANAIYEAENPKPIEPTPPEPEPMKEPTKEDVKVITVEEVKETCFAVYRIVGELEQLRKVSAFLKENDITYKVLDQGKL